MASVKTKAARRLWVAVTLLLLVLGGASAYQNRIALSNFHDDIRYRMDPSADLAFSIAQKHFNSGIEEYYDIDRAREYYIKTLSHDDTYPYAHYELARIAFLRRDFTWALIHIDRERVLYGDKEPTVYYVRGLINGFVGLYAEAAKDYEQYFKAAPANWAGINDYSWILLKMKRYEEAHHALSFGLENWPNNAWLLNNDAIALYELGRYDEARAVAAKAIFEVDKLNKQDWMVAYPGNDPLSAEDALRAFKISAKENLVKINQR